MDWNPDSISQEKLRAYRAAAEQAWGDDTRHPNFIGHPQPSAGQCYVTSKWLATKLGGMVGQLNSHGHYVWLSPDKSHVIDLTGDQFAYEPHHPAVEGMQLDAEDEPWEFQADHRTHRPGPVMFKRADHPLYKGVRPHPANPGDSDYGPRTGVGKRAKLFATRAEQALAGTLPQRTADFGWGGDSHPGQEPQVVERMEHDRPSARSERYKWVFANGRLELDPESDYNQLSDFVGAGGDHAGPIALGEVHVSNDGAALWQATGNVGLGTLSQVLRDHCDKVGWQWGGIKDLKDNRLAHAMWMAWSEETGHLFMSEDIRSVSGLPHTRVGKVNIVGQTATVDPEFYKYAAEGLDEWAADHKISLDTTIKTPEDIDGYDTYGPRPDYAQGPTDLSKPTGTLKCPECGQVFPSFGTYLLHRKEEEPVGDELDREDGHFPEMDMDKVLPPHFHDREPRIFPLAKTAAKLDRHMDELWDTDRELHLGAYVNGDLVGQASINRDSQCIHTTAVRHPEVVYARLVQNAQLRFDWLEVPLPTKAEQIRLARLNFVEVQPGLWKWAKGKEPMDMIKDSIPFIYDVDKDEIHVGQPGKNHHSIMGDFTPGGIVEGFYEPGGVVTVTNQTQYPWTVRHLVDLWYWSLPHMRVTDVQYEDPMGNKTKLTKTAQAVGQYVKQLAAMDPAVWKAYQALEDAGGEVFAVGGVVRDALMGVPSNDIDLMVTGLHPDQVHAVLSALPGKMDVTGKSFGVYRYNFKGHEVEVALPRKERSTGDRRVDFDVTVDHTMPVEQDLERRDFTINSPAVSLKDGRMVDPFGAADDIKNGVLRTTHPNSFKEDPTRLLRALVMNARYGVQPDERTRAEMEQLGHSIHNESWDNMNDIMDKLLKAKNPASGIRLAQETGLLKHIIPELASAWDYDQRNPHHAHSLGTHHMHVLEGVAAQTDDPDVRMAALLHDIGKPASRAIKCIDCNHVWHEDDNPENPFQCPRCGSHNTKGTFHGGDGIGHDHALVGAAMAEGRLNHMKLSKARIKRISELIRHHMFADFSSPKGARKFLNRVGDHADDLMILRHADMYGKGVVGEPEMKTPVDHMRGLMEQARQAPAPTALSGLAVNGRDLIAAGVPQGPMVGQILNMLMEQVIENPELNSKEALIGLAQGQLNAPATQPQT